jgi:uncharacterized protein (TIGR02271 family)
MRTITAVFDRLDQAKSTMNDFAHAGLPVDRVGLLARHPTGDGVLTSVDVPGLGRVSANRAMREMLASNPPRQGGIREALMRLGVSPQESVRYADAIENGAIFEAVIVDDTKEPAVRAIMNRYASTGTDIGDIVVPVIREELRVGTREVNAGGVRVSSHVREVPVEQTVTIREERITVERRIIDRPIDDADEPFRDRSIDLRARAEEPVVSKRAHVVEEIRIHKDRDERTQRINDVLRHTDVQLSEIPSERTFDATRYAEHFKKTYADRYDLRTIAPAYEFGERLSRHAGDSDFTKIETDARAHWEQRNPGTWERYREAILAGWNKVRH